MKSTIKCQLKSGYEMIYRLDSLSGRVELFEIDNFGLRYFELSCNYKGFEYLINCYLDSDFKITTSRILFRSPSFLDSSSLNLNDVKKEILSKFSYEIRLISN